MARLFVLHIVPPSLPSNDGFLERNLADL
jgi:hypothetical protein